MRNPIVVPVVLAALAVAGCEKSPETVAVTEKRELAAPRPENAFAGDVHARMGLGDGPGFAHPPMNGAGAAAPTLAGFEQGSLTWKAPQGWTEGAARQMR